MLAVFAFCSSIAVAAESEPPIALGYPNFDSHFRQILDAGEVPGGAYAIVRDGRIVQAAGHGLRDANDSKTIDAETVFRVASVSKTFAAQLTGLLVREGKLHWDDPVYRFVPDFQLKNSRHTQTLQIQHLLSQSTGIVPNAYDNLLDANVKLIKILPKFRELSPVCQPGECYTYQNILFGLIDPVIEQATQQQYSDLIQQRLFNPLAMQQASIGQADFENAANRALPHVKRQKRWMQTVIQPGYYQVSPAAGVNASVTDLGKWLIAQMGYHPDILPPEVTDELTRERVRTDRELRRRGWRELLTDAHYGLGWRIYQLGDETIYLHSGWVKGYVADIAYSRKHRVGLVVLLNAESGHLNDITTEFWRQTLALEDNNKKPKKKPR